MNYKSNHPPFETKTKQTTFYKLIGYFLLPPLSSSSVCVPHLVQKTSSHGVITATNNNNHPHSPSFRPCFQPPSLDPRVRKTPPPSPHRHLPRYMHHSHTLFFLFQTLLLLRFPPSQHSLHLPPLSQLPRPEQQWRLRRNPDSALSLSSHVLRQRNPSFTLQNHCHHCSHC